MPMRWLAAILVAGGLAASSARAEVVEIDGTRLDLPIPEGWCASDPGHEADAVMIQINRDMLGPQNELVLLFSPCEDRDSFRSGEVPEGKILGIWAFQKSPGGEAQRVPLSRQDYVREFGRQVSGQLMDYTQAQAKERAAGMADKHGISIAVGEMALHKLAETPNAFYMRSQASADVEGEAYQTISVTGLTQLKGYLLGVSLRHEDLVANVTGDPTDDLRRHAEQLVDGAVAANPD